MTDFFLGLQKPGTDSGLCGFVTRPIGYISFIELPHCRKSKWGSLQSKKNVKTLLSSHNWLGRGYGNVSVHSNEYIHYTLSC